MTTFLREFRADMNRSFEAVNARLDSVEQQLRDLTGRGRPLDPTPKRGGGRRNKGRKQTREQQQPLLKVQQQQLDATNSSDPGESLAHICRYLPVVEFMKLRAVSRRWKQLIDECPALMERAGIMIYRRHTAELDTTYEPKCLPPAVTRLLTVNVDIISVAHWWSTVGQRLVHLELFRETIQESVLLDLLSQTPRLKSLRLIIPVIRSNNAKSHDIVQLDNLESLQGYNHNDKILLKLYCPRLKQLTCYRGEPAKQWLDTTKDTLEELNVQAFPINTVNFFATLVELKNITKLKIQAAMTSKEFQEMMIVIGTNMPKLTSLICLQHSSKEVPLFGSYLDLACMRSLTKLENLQIGSDRFVIDCNLLQIGALQKVCFVGFSLINSTKFLSTSPDIRSASFGQCRFDGWLEMFVAIAAQHPSLLRLEIRSCSVADDVDFPFFNLKPIMQNFKELRYLTLSRTKIPKTMLKLLLSCCPKVVELYVYHMNNFDDELVSIVCQHMKHLRVLVVSECNITDTAKNDVTVNCQMLAQFDIVDCSKETPNDYEDLTKFHRLFGRLSHNDEINHYFDPTYVLF